jgi:hypothetical protein
VSNVGDVLGKDAQGSGQGWIWSGIYCTCFQGLRKVITANLSQNLKTWVQKTVQRRLHSAVMYNYVLATYYCTIVRVEVMSAVLKKTSALWDTSCTAVVGGLLIKYCTIKTYGGMEAEL